MTRQLRGGGLNRVPLSRFYIWGLTGALPNINTNIYRVHRGSSGDRYIIYAPLYIYIYRQSSPLYRDRALPYRYIGCRIESRPSGECPIYREGDGCHLFATIKGRGAQPTVIVLYLYRDRGTARSIPQPLRPQPGLYI